MHNRFMGLTGRPAIRRTGDAGYPGRVSCLRGDMEISGRAGFFLQGHAGQSGRYGSMCIHTGNHRDLKGRYGQMRVIENGDPESDGIPSADKEE